jgi:hypothetical protein
MLCSGGRHGGAFSAKIIIHPGAQPYPSLHSTANVAYTLGFPVVLALNFSHTAVGGDYEACATEVPADKPYRWRDPAQVRIVERPTGGMLYQDFATGADGNAEGVLEIEQRSGLYLLTVNIHDPAADTGPMTISTADGPLLADVTVKRGEYWARTLPLRIRGGKTELRFSGDWKVGALSLQLLQYETEDFLFDQPFWNMAVASEG